MKATKLVIFAINGRERIGVVKDTFVIDLNTAYSGYLGSKGVSDPDRRADAHIPPIMRSFIEQGDQVNNAVFPLEK